MIKTLFFGYLTLGWKRLFRAVIFGLCVWWLCASVDAVTDSDWRFSVYYNWLIEVQIITFVGLLSLMLLSYIISGFILQNKRKG